MTNRTLEEETNSLAAYWPGGIPTAARYIQDTVMRNYLRGLSVEQKRIDDFIQLFLDEHNINTTTLLIDEWERALGIPDECFFETTSLPIEQRRAQIAAKIFMRQAYTEDDYYTLRDILYPGLPMVIEHVPGEYFIMRIHFQGSLCTNLFPLPFPLPFGGCPNLPLVCVFNKIKPANKKIIYVYDLP